MSFLGGDNKDAKKDEQKEFKDTMKEGSKEHQESHQGGELTNAKGAPLPHAKGSDKAQSAPKSVDAMEHRAKRLAFDVTIGNGPEKQGEAKDPSLSPGDPALPTAEAEVQDSTKLWMAAQKDPEKYGDKAKLKKGEEAKEEKSAKSEKSDKESAGDKMFKSSDKDGKDGDEHGKLDADDEKKKSAKKGSFETATKSA